MATATFELMLSWLCQTDQRQLPPQSVTVPSVVGVTSRPFTLAAGISMSFTIGATAADDLPTLNYLFMNSNQDTSIEIQGATAAANSNLIMKANRGFMFGGAQTRAYNAAGGFAGAAANILKITLRNDGAATANLWVVLA